MVQQVDLERMDPAAEPLEEKLHRVGRVAIGAIPVIGSLALETFNSIFEPPLSKRRTEVIRQIGEALNDLIEGGVVTEAGLQENEAFISTVAEVCNISLRNHQAEKLEALRNAAINSALPGCPSDDYRQIFLHFVDVCTVSHIRLLKFFENPKRWFVAHNRAEPYRAAVSLSQVIEHAMPDLTRNREILDTVWADLYQKGLVGIKQLEMVLSHESCFSKQTTSFGSKLIAFLSSPST
ncbi:MULTISPECIES: hypothetical protein [Pseudomonas]|uniref:Uncharacterized protein n=1 Tax=Pseudomonas aphyarum TaxID=2942629 RepID=A0ABT5PH06_9PSED|nr:hypothetical protein [Pseudomonas aphyarum]MDD0967784.1 hypothetical protein [Pseudomonas aphyarum]MDD1123095.1 hypothetical protein [Pseudomonas aphyarum]